jgi:surface carbohydrate biosynthesis protein
MTTHQLPVLLIPVENQVRELDAKLCLACVAAETGLSSIVGPKRKIENHIASFPQGIYLSKSLRIAKRNFFPIVRQLGHEIVAWDEEALVHLPPEMYYSRRLSPVGFQHISHLFAWGEDNVELWRGYPHLPPGIPIHITGNPRADLLRPDIQGYYQAEADQIQQEFGDFILINTNFNHVNAFYPTQNLFQPTHNPGDEVKIGQAGRGMPLEYAEGLRDHKQAVFEDFQKLIPRLANEFQEQQIVVRPHPTENQEIYHQIASRCRRVTVTNEGNVVPWLVAAKMLIHNGCTTGVEAYMMRVPAISFRATVNDEYDDGFYSLSNRLSHQCFDFAELAATVGHILSGELGAPGGDERDRLVDRFLAGREGPLASERMRDMLLKIAHDLLQTGQPLSFTRLVGRYRAARRRLRKTYKSYLSGSFKSLDFEQHRYPGINVGELVQRITRFQQVLGHDTQLHVHQLHKQVFRISAA